MSVFFVGGRDPSKKYNRRDWSKPLPKGERQSGRLQQAPKEEPEEEPKGGPKPKPRAVWRVTPTVSDSEGAADTNADNERFFTTPTVSEDSFQMQEQPAESDGVVRREVHQMFKGNRNGSEDDVTSPSPLRHDLSAKPEPFLYLQQPPSPTVLERDVQALTAAFSSKASFSDQANTGACWKHYTQKGMKMKGDHMVPNCVPCRK